MLISFSRKLSVNFAEMELVGGYNNKEDIRKSPKFLNNNMHFKEEYFPKRPTLDLSFKNIRYTVTSWRKFKYGRFSDIFRLSMNYFSLICSPAAARVNGLGWGTTAKLLFSRVV